MKHAVNGYILPCLCLFSFQCVNAIEFNLDLLDAESRDEIDLAKFRTAGYIAPGQYRLQLVVNSHSVGDYDVTYLPAEDGASRLCLIQPQLEAIGLKENELNTVLATQDEEGCYDLLQLPGVTAQGELQRSLLTLAVPQAYLVYIADGWDPPSSWDSGINGVMLDYGLSLQQNLAAQSGRKRTDMSAYGVAGLNLADWRIRADWQGKYSDESDLYKSRQFTVNRVYGYRSLPDMASQLQVGEVDLGMSVFDSFSFLGAVLTTDERMLPPNLRGYAPEVVGIAKTNAKVVISQQGRILYETQVPSGPFRIQDLDSYVIGMLDVRVEEQDGTVQTFQVNSANIPYLSRPGSVRYKLASGKASSAPHQQDGPAFMSGEFSWGVSNGWSLLGGGLLSDNYQSAAIGIGRDLLALGAISVDMSESWAHLPKGERKSGASYRVNYSKSFDEQRAQIAFAGYRFSERDFMNMSNFVEANKRQGNYSSNQKELYSVILSKQFDGSSLSSYVDYTHQSYWNQQASERVSLSLSSNVALMDWKGVTSSLTMYRSKQGEQLDNGFYLSLSVPFGLNKSISYGASSNTTGTSHDLRFSNSSADGSNYSLTASTAGKSGSDSISAFYSHRGDIVDMSVNGSHQPGSSSGIGLYLTGGMTATAYGAALHRVSSFGGTRTMIDTDAAGDVPVSSVGPSVRTNRYGKAVLVDIASYNRAQTKISVDELNDDVDLIGSPVRSASLTEGAIGYQKFEMLSGGKRMVQLKQPSGKYVPMAATVYNHKQQQVGMVADDGMVYLTGLQQGESLQVDWGSGRCELALPTPLPAMDDIATLACR